MSKNEMKDGVMPLKGRLDLTMRNKNTGEVIDEFGDNMVVRVGMEQILRSITVASPPGGSLQYILQEFKLGSDIGSGTLLNPEPAQPDYTAANQTPVYTVPYGDLTINFPSYYAVEINLVLDGNEVMAQYPGDVDLRFSSAALYSGDGEVFAYRRFQTRTITREIVIDAKWTLYFDGQGGV